MPPGLCRATGDDARLDESRVSHPRDADAGAESCCAGWGCRPALCRTLSRSPRLYPLHQGNNPKWLRTWRYVPGGQAPRRPRGEPLRRATPPPTPCLTLLYIVPMQICVAPEPPSAWGDAKAWRLYPGCAADASSS